MASGLFDLVLDPLPVNDFEMPHDSFGGVLNIVLDQTERTNVGWRYSLDVFLLGERVGFIQVEEDSEDAVYRWGAFYPLDELPDDLRIGLGTIVHVGVLQYALEELRIPPHYHVDREGSYVSTERQDHLEKLGVPSGATLEQELGAAVEYAERKGLFGEDYHSFLIEELTDF